MSRRIEIELTSKRNENEWTWRAAGAKQPKGVLDASVLYEGAKVGDISKAEADFELDGITILKVHKPQEKRQDFPGKVDVIGPKHPFKGVTSDLARSNGRPDGKPSGRPAGRGGRRSIEPRGERDARASRESRDRQGHVAGKGPRRESDRSRVSRPGSGQSGSREAIQRGDGQRGDGQRGDGRNGTRRGKEPARAAPRYKKLSPKDTHRRALLAEIDIEWLPVAEQALRGGMPAVRRFIEVENAEARTKGRPELDSSAQIAMAEELLPRLKSAEWIDRAEAAKAIIDGISIRDLRSVVASSDTLARTENARLLAGELREKLEALIAEEGESWLRDIGTALDEGRIVRALNLSARPPDPQVKFPPELLERLTEAAQSAMAPDTPEDRWITLIEAVSASPVRRSVEPVGLPENPGDALKSAAKQAAGRIPALARRLGISMPPPPSPRKRLPSPPPRPVVAEDTAEGTGSE